MVRQIDVAPWGYVRPEPAVSVTQALAAGLALVAVNVALFVWLVCGVGI